MQKKVAAVQPKSFGYSTSLTNQHTTVMVKKELQEKEMSWYWMLILFATAGILLSAHWWLPYVGLVVMRWLGEAH